MALDLRTSELEHQFIENRINSVEDNFSELCVQFSKYVKRAGQLRDSGDELSRTILKISSKEILNHSLRRALNHFSDTLSAIQDYREAEVQRLNHKIIGPLSSYGHLCKHTKDDLKRSFAARTRELTKKNHLEKLRGKKPPNWQQIAEREADLARDESTHAVQQLAQKIDAFERGKLENLKTMFLEFANIELLFHCKAVEMFTHAYGAIKEIKVDEDLQVFRDRFKSSCIITEANLSSVTTEAIPAETSVAKNQETLPLKTVNALDESTTTLSSFTGLSSISANLDTPSEGKNDLTNPQNLKSFRWDY